MKLPRFQLAIRTLMIAVGTVAVMLAAGISTQRIMQRRALLLQKAAWNAEQARGWLRSGPSTLASAERGLIEANLAVEAGPRSGPLAEYLAQDAADMRARLEGTRRGYVPHSREMADYHEQMRRKYRLAASRPWLSVDPDPPPPPRFDKLHYAELAITYAAGAQYSWRRAAFMERRIAEGKVRGDARVSRWEKELAFARANAEHSEQVARICREAVPRPDGTPPTFPPWPKFDRSTESPARGEP